MRKDLGLAGKKSKRDSTVQTKEYLAYTFLGIALPLYYKLNKARLLNDDLYLLGIKMALAVHALHTGQHSKTPKSYIHGDIHEGNIVVDKDDNPHIIDFDCTRLLTLQNQEQAVFDTQSLFSRCFYKNHDGSPGIFGELNKDAAFNKLLFNLLKIQPALKFAETLTLYRLGMDGIVLEEASLSENQRLNRIKWLNALDKELFKLYATLGSNERKSEIQTIILQSLSHGAAIKFDSFLKQHPDTSKELRSSLRQITKIQCKKEVIELVNVLRLVGNKTPQLNEFIESLVTLVETKINTPDLKRDMIVVFKVEYEQSIIAIQKEIESTKDPVVIHIFNAVKTAINALMSVFYAFLNHTPYVRYNFLTIHSSSSIISQKVNEFKASLDGLCDTLLNDTLDEPEQYLEKVNL